MKSLHRKINIFVVLNALLAIVVTSAVCLFLFYANMTSQLQESVSALATSYSQSVSNKIDTFKAGMEVMATLPEITQADPAKQSAFLAELADSAGFTYLAVADSSGHTSSNANIADREYFQKAMAGTTYMSSPLISRSDSSITIILATPINNKSGQQGILYGAIPYDVFSSLVKDIKIGEGGYAFVVDHSGITVAHPDKAEVAKMTSYIDLAKEDSQYQPIADAITRMVAGETGTARTVYNGQQRLVGFTPIEGPEQWSIAVTIPVSQLMGNVYHAIIYCLIAGVILLLLSILLGLLFSRAISRPIIAVTKRIEQLERGDLSTPIPAVKGRDEIARLADALKNTIGELKGYISDISLVLTAMANNDFTVASSTVYRGDFSPIQTALANISSSLTRTLTTIRASSNQVSHGAAQVSSEAQELATGATQQAASIEELNASIARIAEQAEANMKNIRLVSEAVLASSQGLQNSNEHMVRLTGAMKEISDSSEQIASITKAIEDIAFQTNILALNASVEAARAGSAGKGFAVVADEVRNLASKSAEAAQQTRLLIQQVSGKISEGSAITGITAGLLQDVVGKSQNIISATGAVSEASAEQTASIEQITHELSQVALVVQSNAATAQESSATSQELSAEADTLREEVDRFKLSGTEDGSAPEYEAEEA